MIDWHDKNLIETLYRISYNAYFIYPSKRFVQFECDDNYIRVSLGKKNSLNVHYLMNITRKLV